jgi:hypothetical protein
MISNLSLQPVYAILTELPAVFLLYDSSLWSGVFLIVIFAVSVWNGGGFYIEVFGRKFVPSLLFEVPFRPIGILLLFSEQIRARAGSASKRTSR